MRLRLGLAALSNRHFDNILFPIGTRHDAYLPAYASRFDTLELAQLYHAPEPPEQVLRWAQQAPEGFTFTAKVWKRAVAPESGRWDDACLEAAEASLHAMAPLRDAGVLGPVVAQFPPSFHRTQRHHAWLEALLGLAPAGALAVELRHPSWWADATRRLLEDHAAPLVWSTHDKAPAPDWVTGDVGYVRFCGTAFPERGRHVTVRDRLEAVLAMRARLAPSPTAWDDCHVIITNPFEGNAIDSLPRIAAALGQEDLARACTRVPGRPLFDDPTAIRPPGQAALDLE